MNAWKIVKREVGSKFWLSPAHTGRINGDLPSGQPRMAPRMTVIDDTCRTLLMAVLVALGSFGLFPVLYIIAAIAEPDKFMNGWLIFTGLVLTIGTLSLFNALVAAIRLDTLMPVVGSPLVKGIHFDWGKPNPADDQDKAKDEDEREPEDERVGAYKQMLTGEGST